MNRYIKREPITKSGKRLRAWRLRQGWSQAQAAQIVGLEQSSWARLELGERYPGREVARRLTKRTGIPVDVLLGIAS